MIKAADNSDKQLSKIISDLEIPESCVQLSDHDVMAAACKHASSHWYKEYLTQLELRDCPFTIARELGINYKQVEYHRIANESFRELEIQARERYQEHYLEKLKVACAAHPNLMLKLGEHLVKRLEPKGSGNIEINNVQTDKTVIGLTPDECQEQTQRLIGAYRKESN